MQQQQQTGAKLRPGGQNLIQRLHAAQLVACGLDVANQQHVYAE